MIFLMMARNKAFDESVVLDQAMEVFWSQGYNATSMQDLVDGMGINRASLYDTFGDKHELFLKALNNYRSQQARDMIALLEQTPSVKVAIQTLLRGIVQSSNCINPKGCFMVNAAVEFFPNKSAEDQRDERKAVLDIVCNNFQTVEKALCAAIARGQASGEVTSQQSPEALAALLINTFNGMRVAERAGYESAYYESVISVVESILFE